MRDWHELAGGTLLVGFEGTVLDPETIRRLGALAPAGAILFARNLSRPETATELIAALGRAIPSAAPIIAIDQEGGRVSRLQSWIGPTPSAARLARAEPEVTRQFAAATGAALRALGFSLDFAPVVDLCGPDASNGIGDRSFGTDPTTVIAHARSFLEGLQGAGVAGALKHFPGLGPTCVDSHEHLPTCTHDRARIERTDLAPFRALSTLAAAVMVGHAHYPALDDEAGRPASLSPPIVSGLLRGTLGFRGLVVTDDLDMGAVAPLDHDGRAAVRAIEAGCDLLLYCRRLDRAESAARALADRARHDAAFGERLARAAAAVRRFAECWPAAVPRLEHWEQARSAMMDTARAAAS